MSTGTENSPAGPKIANIEQERDAYKEALEEILAQCRRAERDQDEHAYRVAVESQIPFFANEVLTLYAPDPEPVREQELPFK